MLNYCLFRALVTLFTFIQFNRLITISNRHYFGLSWGWNHMRTRTTWAVVCRFQMGYSKNFHLFRNLFVYSITSKNGTNLTKLVFKKRICLDFSSGIMSQQFNGFFISDPEPKPIYIYATLKSPKISVFSRILF